MGWSGMSSGEFGRYVKFVSDIRVLSGAGGLEWDDCSPSPLIERRLAGAALGIAVLLGAGDLICSGVLDLGGMICCGSRVANSDGTSGALGNCNSCCVDCSGYGDVGTNAWL